ncbi:hypothetical protein H9Y04_21215 [Streptomyces sp. TRM66268-LWL]|uniref:Lipoprotein n=1 Tax=Streptomyces polyasparticus TaxID=2767826 RepID=A0ABR7SK45_9ACTN|nr:hypothetical protein [Streptomyces polyasparticus]MBC9715075.1 hypothetical protein [Streptomyces polyasparticus]
MGRRLLCAAVTLLTLALASCGAGTDDLVVEGSPPPSPYDGPLNLLPDDVTDEDEDDAFTPVEALGSAGRALECDWEVRSGGRAETWGDAGGDTPEEGLALYFEMDQPGLPQTGYRVERKAQGRVLYSYDVEGRTKIAVVVAKDQPKRPGWGPETTAHCDVAELPESFTDGRGEEIWQDRDGRRVPLAFISSSKGAEHCDWQRAHFLQLDSGQKRSLYIRDPHRVLPGSMLTSPYDGDTVLPADAKDSGYRLDDWQLWRTADPSAVYVRTSEGVERWPAAGPEGCL